MEQKKWSKEEIKTLVSMWSEHTIEDIAETLGKKKKQVIQMAYTIRQSYPKELESKRTGYEDVLKEIFES